eukprot:2361246-Prymnesium_polylepis.1
MPPTSHRRHQPADGAAATSPAATAGCCACVCLWLRVSEEEAESTRRRRQGLRVGGEELQQLEILARREPHGVLDRPLAPRRARARRSGKQTNKQTNRPKGTQTNAHGQTSSYTLVV